MSPRERRIGTHGQGTIGGHGHSDKDPRPEKTETSRRALTEVFNRTRGGQESSGRRRDGKIRANSPDHHSLQENGRYSNQQLVMDKRAQVT